jgi:hypothetical protein
VAESSGQLVEAAQAALDAEMARRSLTGKDVAQFAAAIEQAEAARVVASAGPHQPYGIGKRFLGRANLTQDALTGAVEYDTTLWVTVLYFPVFPIRSLRIRKNRDGNDEIQVIQCKPRDWGQILRTWMVAVCIILLIPWLLDLLRRL